MIREATEKDIAGILEIYNDAVLNTTATYDYKPVTLEERLIYYNKKKSGGYPFFVYEEDGQVAGYATFGTFREKPAYKYTVEHSVYVHKDFRNRGIATEMMKLLLKTADEMGFATMVAGIDSLNEGSIKVHKKLGFIFSGRITKAGYKFGKWLDLDFYQIALKGPDNPAEE